MASPSLAKINGTIGQRDQSSVTHENYAYLQMRVYAESGIVLDQDKHYLLESRLVPIVRKEQLKSLDDLCAQMRRESSGVLLKQVVEAMTTNETLFFRDVGPFQALRTTIVPELQKLRTGAKRIRFWSAACSSGQEAYSLAMMLMEMGLTDSSIEIFATDLSDQILERARLGRYSQLEVNRGLPAQLLVKYFYRDGMDWKLKEEVRKMVHFRKFDLRQNMSSMGAFDVILCRNVLIYFDIETKKSILSGFRGVLNPGGFLFLGAAETTLNLDDNFKRVMMGSAVLYRLG